MEERKIGMSQATDEQPNSIWGLNDDGFFDLQESSPAPHKMQPSE